MKGGWPPFDASRRTDGHMRGAGGGEVGGQRANRTSSGTPSCDAAAAQLTQLPAGGVREQKMFLKIIQLFEGYQLYTFFYCD